MNLKVLRPADGVMMKLVKYELVDGTDVAGSSTSTLIHNHNLSSGNNDTSVTTVDKSGTAGGSAVSVSVTDVAQAISSNTAVATVAVSTDSISITPVTAGTATITALDSNGVPITVVNMTVGAAG